MLSLSNTRSAVLMVILILEFQEKVLMKANIRQVHIQQEGTGETKFRTFFLECALIGS